MLRGGPVKPMLIPAPPPPPFPPPPKKKKTNKQTKAKPKDTHTKRNLRLNFFTAPFTNVRTLKFSIKVTVALSIAVNHCSETLRKQKRFAQRDQKDMPVRCDLRISIHFVAFAVIMIDSC